MANTWNVSFEFLYSGQFTFSTQLIKPKLLFYTLPLTQHHSLLTNLTLLYSDNNKILGSTICTFCLSMVSGSLSMYAINHPFSVSSTLQCPNWKKKKAIIRRWKSLYTLTSVSIFLKLSSVHNLWYWPGEFV